MSDRRLPVDRNFSGTIAAAIKLALEVLHGPRLAAGRLAPLTDLAELVEAQREIMVEGGNPLRVELTMLVTSLGEIEMARLAGEATDRWEIVAAGLLVMVRELMPLALTVEARRPSTSNQDGAGR